MGGRPYAGGANRVCEDGVSGGSAGAVCGLCGGGGGANVLAGPAAEYMLEDGEEDEDEDEDEVLTVAGFGCDWTAKGPKDLLWCWTGAAVGSSGGSPEAVECGRECAARRR